MEEKGLSEEQTRAEQIYAELLAKVLAGRNIFLTGPGGTGKSYLLKRLVRELSMKPAFDCIAVTATTGVAALNIEGTTLHAWGGLEIGNRAYDYYVHKIEKNEVRRTLWRKCKLLIIDEVSMLGKKLFHLLDHVGKSIRMSNAPVGGVQLIFCGDMCQLPPVEDEYCFMSPLFTQCKFDFIRLTHPWRFVSDLKYFELLLRVRLGEQTPEDIALLETRKCSLFKMSHEEGEIRPTRLFSRKMDVEGMNLEELYKLPDEEHQYFAFDSFNRKYQNAPGEEEKYAQIMDSRYQRSIRLKKGAQVMLNYNLCPEKGLINGSRGVVLECHDSTVLVRFRHQDYLILPIRVNYEDDHCKYSRVLIPLILAWSMTIHKSQSATLDLVIADLGSSIFSKNMAYVVLSRCRSLDSLYLNNLMPEKIECDPLAKEFEKEIEKKLGK